MLIWVRYEQVTLEKVKNVCYYYKYRYSLKGDDFIRSRLAKQNNNIEASENVSFIVAFLNDAHLPLQFRHEACSIQKFYNKNN